MKWNVYYYNINKRRIETYNIFDHSGFTYYIRQAAKEAIKTEDIELFTDKLKRELQYYFWSKAEWEVIISPWLGLRDSEEIKIDVYDQIMLNWNVFARYVWNNKEQLIGESDEV